jgi:hypothetical protein
LALESDPRWLALVLLGKRARGVEVDSHADGLGLNDSANVRRREVEAE